MSEVDKIIERYERRKVGGMDSLYQPLNPSVYLNLQEKERAIIRWITTSEIAPLSQKKLLDIGCGSGSNLLQLIRLGFSPENLVGNELLKDRVVEARRILPSSVLILPGDANSLELERESFDIVMQHVVFSSILDNNFQAVLAGRMWKFVKPGGGVLWYDFVYDNPRNPDVRGVPLRRIMQLFPSGKITKWRITLAPPISRRVTRIHPMLYSVFNIIPFLRTHLLCWIKK